MNIAIETWDAAYCLATLAFEGDEHAITEFARLLMLWKQNRWQPAPPQPNK